MGEVARIAGEPTALAKQTGEPWAFTPRSLTEAMDYAKLIAESSLVPPAFKNKPGDVLIAVQWGAEIGLKPMAALQNISVVNNRPAIWGALGKAVLLGSGLVEDYQQTPADEIKKTGKARVVIKRKGIPTPFVGEFSLEDAKRAGLVGKNNYASYPERQLQWRAFWYAANDGFADVLKGIQGAEELLDVEPAEAPAKVSLMPRSKSEARVIEDGPKSHVEFEIQGRPYQTAGITRDQMLATFELAPKVDARHGKNTSAKLLHEKFGAHSRNALTEDEAAEYIADLTAALEGAGD